MSQAELPIRRILVPLDLNRLSEVKLPASEAQARAFGAQVILLHVISSAAPADDAVTLAESQALTYLNAIAARLRSEGIEAQSLVRYGPVAQAILDEVRQQDIDLVVLGANVRRGIQRRLLGSVAEEIVEKAPCPVLLVRPDVALAEKAHAVRSFAEDMARAGAAAPRSLGIRNVDVARIVGSVGRAGELDANFRVMNRKRPEQQRYDRVRKAMDEGVPLPPVVLYKLGYGYYVLDGNHRVAAAKEIGQLELEAEVTEFVPLGDARSQRIFAERRAFERVTGRTQIGVAQPGNYPKLEAMISKFAEERGIDDLKEAARRWESEVYRSVARRIRRHRLSQFYPDHRTADIFVELEEFREAESEREGRDLSIDEVLPRFSGRQPTPAAT